MSGLKLEEANGQKGDQLGRSVTHFSAPNAPKMGRSKKFCEEIGINDTILAPQAQNFLRKFDILVN